MVSEYHKGPSLKWLFFSFTGRIARQSYILSQIFILALQFLILWQIAKAADNKSLDALWGLVFIRAGQSVSDRPIERLWKREGLKAPIVFIEYIKSIKYLGKCWWRSQSCANQSLAQISLLLINLQGKIHKMTSCSKI